MDVKELPPNFNRYGRWSKVAKGKPYADGYSPCVVMIHGPRSNSFFKIEISQRGETFLYAVKDQNKPPCFIGKAFPESLELESALPEDTDEWSNILAMQKLVLYNFNDKKIEMRYTASSAVPLVKYEFKNTCSVFLGAKIKLDKGIGYKYLFVPGIGLKSLAEPGSLELGEIADNWVLLYHGIRGDFPILIAFDKKPKLIEWGGVKNSVLAGMDHIGFCFTTSEFITYIGLLEGAALVNTETWRNEIPEEKLRKATILAHEILTFPVDLSEEASADWEQKTVRITRKYHFSTVPNPHSRSSPCSR